MSINITVIRNITLGAVLLFAPFVQSASINQDVAKAYNDGVVRCGNSECAKYLYACFRTYASTTLQEFLACGVQASRLNDDQRVVANPKG